LCRHASRAGAAVDAAASARDGAGRAGSPCELETRVQTSGAARFVSPVSFAAPSTGLEILRRSGGPCVRQNRVVLAVVATVKSFAKVRASPTGRTASSNSRGEGGQRKVRLPGEHGISRPTIAQGRPSDRHHLYAAVRSSCATFRAADRGCELAPGLPCALLDFRGTKDEAKLGRTSREAEEACL